ncbi:MAG TPA: hypothetical protein VFZ53_24320 [Polyangiaceae bacterium]
MRLLRLLVIGLLVSAAPRAHAQPLLQPPSPVPVPNDEPEAPLVPPATDTLGGHLVAGGSAAFVVPWGDLQQGSESSDLGAGYGFNLDVGYGLGRSVVVGLWGQYALYTESTECSGCRASSYAVGPFIRYHLVQGMRFDPWLLAGIGYRAMNVDAGSAEGDYAGVEWLRLALGGDYYPVKNFGFGPIVELDAGVFAKHPADERGTSLHFTFVGGLRLVLDVPGK